MPQAWVEALRLLWTSWRGMQPTVSVVCCLDWLVVWPLLGVVCSAPLKNKVCLHSPSIYTLVWTPVEGLGSTTSGIRSVWSQQRDCRLSLSHGIGVSGSVYSAISTRSHQLHWHRCHRGSCGARDRLPHQHWYWLGPRSGRRQMVGSNSSLQSSRDAIIWTLEMRWKQPHSTCLPDHQWRPGTTTLHHCLPTALPGRGEE